MCHFHILIYRQRRPAYLGGIGRRRRDLEMLAVVDLNGVIVTPTVGAGETDPSLLLELVDAGVEIGRASCRERVSFLV